MLSYLSKVNANLKSKKGGMEKNSPLWQGIRVNISEVELMIKNLEEKNTEVAEAKIMYQAKVKEARALANDAWRLDERIENLAKGLHGSDPVRLFEYNIKPQKAEMTREAPAKT